MSSVQRSGVGCWVFVPVWHEAKWPRCLESLVYLDIFSGKRGKTVHDFLRVLLCVLLGVWYHRMRIEGWGIWIPAEIPKWSCIYSFMSPNYIVVCGWVLIVGVIGSVQLRRCLSRSYNWNFMRMVQSSLLQELLSCNYSFLVGQNGGWDASQRWLVKWLVG